MNGNELSLGLKSSEKMPECPTLNVVGPVLVRQWSLMILSILPLILIDLFFILLPESPAPLATDLVLLGVLDPLVAAVVLRVIDQDARRETVSWSIAFHHVRRSLMPIMIAQLRMYLSCFVYGIVGTIVCVVIVALMEVPKDPGLLGPLIFFMFFIYLPLFWRLAQLGCVMPLVVIAGSDPKYAMTLSGNLFKLRPRLVFVTQFFLDSVPIALVFGWTLFGRKHGVADNIPIAVQLLGRVFVGYPAMLVRVIYFYYYTSWAHKVYAVHKVAEIR